MFKFAVYSPPAPGFPFVAVMVSPDGKVSMADFDTAAEAEAFNESFAIGISRDLGGKFVR